MVNQTSTSGGLLAPPGSLGGSIGSNRHSFTLNDDSSSDDDDDDDDDSDDSDDDDDDPKPGLQIAGVQTNSRDCSKPSRTRPSGSSAQTPGNHRQVHIGHRGRTDQVDLSQHRVPNRH